MKIHPAFVLLSIAILVFSSACSFETTKAVEPVAAQPNAESVKQEAFATIDIKPGSPSETVQAFYTKLRERKIREAIFLTNLRPAIEGLTDDELKDFAVDFEAIARLVPKVIEINGEVVSGDLATVTARLPDANNEKLEVQQIRLRKEGENWTILTADEDAEKMIRKEGKNYFHTLRIETHHEEAKKMLDRIATAQLLYSLQNKGQFAELIKLVAAGLVPADVSTSESTGYIFSMQLTPDSKAYFVSAIPAAYGKSGKLSFTLEPGQDGKAKMQSADAGGRPLGK